jgi:hypothetical protein
MIKWDGPQVQCQISCDNTNNKSQESTINPFNQRRFRPHRQQNPRVHSRTEGLRIFHGYYYGFIKQFTLPW